MCTMYMFIMHLCYFVTIQHGHSHDLAISNVILTTNTATRIITYLWHVGQPVQYLIYPLDVIGDSIMRHTIGVHNLDNNLPLACRTASTISYIPPRRHRDRIMRHTIGVHNLDNNLPSACRTASTISYIPPRSHP